MEQTLQHVGPPLIANPKPATAQKPGLGALDDPAVPSQPLAGVDPTASNTWGDAAGTQGTPQVGRVVGLVGVEFRRALPGPARSSSRADDGWNGVEQRDELSRVVGVSG